MTTRPVNVPWAFACRRGLLAFVFVSVLGQVPPILMQLFGGGLAMSTALKLGWFYALAFHRVGIDVTLTGRIGAFRAHDSISIGFLLGTGIALWILYRSGRAVATRSGGGVIARAMAGAAVAPAYAAAFALATPFVRLGLISTIEPFVGTAQVQGVTWQAAVFPFALAAAGGAAGGVAAGLAPGSPVRAWLVGGWRSFLAALALALVAVLVLAGARPAGLAAYVRGVGANGPRTALLLLGHHGLLLPNQSVFVLAASMGGCVEAREDGGRADVLCPGRLPALGAGSLVQGLGALESGAPRTGRAVLTRPMPVGYVAFVLVPLLATAYGGWWASAHARGRRSRTEAAGIGALAGATYAVVFGVAVWLASISVQMVQTIAGRERAVTVAIGPRPMPAALLAFVWGIVGGTVGAALSRNRVGARAQVPLAGAEPADEPPPSPTSV